MSVYKIRYLTPKCLEIQQSILSAFSGGGSNRGRAQISSVEVEGSLAIDQCGILVGELDGKPISFASYLKYDSTYCHWGLFYVQPEYRGKGYGFQICNDAVNRLLPSHIISLCVQDHIKKSIESCFPTHEHWKLNVLDINLHSAFQRVSSLPKSHLYCAVPVDNVDKQSLADYDASVFGYQRHAFLGKWLAAKGGHATVAVTKHNEIVGYVASRVPFVQEIANHLIGPLYANSKEVAMVLLRSLFEEMLKKEGANSSLSNTVVRIRCPVGINSDVTELYEFLGGKVAYESKYMTISTTGKLPKGRFNNWYGMTSGFLGHKLCTDSVDFQNYLKGAVFILGYLFYF